MLSVSHIKQTKKNKNTLMADTITGNQLTATSEFEGSHRRVFAP